MRKTPQDIILLHMSTINEDHMIYGSWNIRCDRQIFLSFWAIFCPCTPKKTKFWKNEKNTWRYYHFTHVYHKWQSCDIWFVRYGAQQTEFFAFWTIFCSFTCPPNNPKKLKFGKNEKRSLKILLFYTCVPKMRIIWCMILEIWSLTDWFLSFWTIFCPFTPSPLPQTTQKLNKKNEKRTPRDIILLQMCTINKDHMMYVFWDIKCNGQIFCHFGPFFALYPLTWKIKIWKKWKKSLNILLFYTCVPKMTIMMYGSWDMEPDKLIFLSLWTIFCPFTPTPPPNYPPKKIF